MVASMRLHAEVEMNTPRIEGRVNNYFFPSYSTLLTTVSAHYTRIVGTQESSKLVLTGAAAKLWLRLK